MYVFWADYGPLGSNSMPDQCASRKLARLQIGVENICNEVGSVKNVFGLVFSFPVHTRVSAQQRLVDGTRSFYRPSVSRSPDRLGPFTSISVLPVF
jgi:hypothetical protein